MTAMAPHTPKLRRLLKRRQFVAAAQGRRASRPALTLQAAQNAEPEPGLGFTVTKKMGNAPARNRIKRRLRAAAEACAESFLPQHDYVLIGRRDALGQSFERLVADLRTLIPKVAGGQAARNEPSAFRNESR